MAVGPQPSGAGLGRQPDLGRVGAETLSLRCENRRKSLVFAEKITVFAGKTMEKHNFLLENDGQSPFLLGKPWKSPCSTHYFDWFSFNNKLLVYQRVNHGLVGDLPWSIAERMNSFFRCVKTARPAKDGMFEPLPFRELEQWRILLLHPLTYSLMNRCCYCIWAQCHIPHTGWYSLGSCFQTQKCGA